MKEILGEPAKIYTHNEDSYMYNAGDIYYYGLFYSERRNYTFCRICRNRNGKIYYNKRATLKVSTKNRKKIYTNFKFYDKIL